MDARLAAYVSRLPRPSSQQQVDPLADTASPAGRFKLQLHSAGLIWRFVALLGAHVIETGFLIASWAFIGSGALSGRLDGGWLTAWALCLASTVPFRIASRWLEGVVAVGVGGLLKERVLAGALTIDAELVRRKGAGELLSEVLEADAIEGLGASGGLETVLAALELLMVPWLLAWGAAASLEIGVLIAWIGIAVILIASNTRERSGWTTLRFDLTQQLVERMIAHRTRLAQQTPSDWHREEDRDHEQYTDASTSLDRSTVRLEAALPRGYLVAAVAALAPSFVAGGATPAQQAITLGAILFAGDALQRLTFGVARGAAAWIAWRGVKPMFDAASYPVPQGSLADLPSTPHTVLQAHDVCFTHHGHLVPAVNGCTLTIDRGDFLLLEGGSGSGKSTFASLLANVRKPSTGVVLAGGLDPQTLGEALWRRRVAVAPQYHENHILSATLGFNLLLGRPYPHAERDVEAAREICEELGLGPLLERMPGGLDQMIGETGWQLSHGERSRIFLGRALLQDADLTVLDESLAALDPENLRQCLECVFRRAKTLLVIAHP